MQDKGTAGEKTDVRAATLTFVACLIAVFLTAAATQSLTSGFIGADESSHFLNAYFIADYIRHGLGQNPLAYAQDFYVHYPKLLIGHWPPAYYGVIGIIFLVVPPTAFNAMVISLVVSVLPALFVAILVARRFGTAAAVAASLWYISLPEIIHINFFFQVDQSTTAAILAAAASWVWFARRPSVGRAVLAGVLLAFAVLVKGNALSLAIFVPLHILFTGRLKLLRDWRTYLAAGVTLAAIAPWYAVTAGIAADGFNYQPGPAYAWLALKANSVALYHQFGAAGLGLAAIGAAVANRERRRDPLAWDWYAVCLAVLIATILLHSVIPVDLVPRYMAPAFPGLAVLAVLGLGGVWSLLRPRAPAWAAIATVALLGVASVLPTARALADIEPKPNERTDIAAAMAARTPAPNAWLIDGYAGDEGAFTALIATRDPDRGRYVVRASQLLSSSNFMGNNFKLKVRSTVDVLAKLRELGIAGVVLVRRNDKPAYGHSDMLLEALSERGSGYARTAVLPALNMRGTTYVFAASAPQKIDILGVRNENFPAKAKALGASK